MGKTIIGVFDNRDDAQNTIDELKARDYNPKDISIIMKHADQVTSGNAGTGVADSTLSGATAGAVIGGLAGLLAAVAIPGLGAFLIGGPIAASLGLTGAAAATVSGAATGVLAGGLLGALSGLGLSDEDAKVYQRAVEEGGILVAVPARHGEEHEVREVFDANSAGMVRVLTLHDPAVERDDHDYDRGAYFAGMKGGHTRRNNDRGRFGED
jgi:uncharacterized membrane protein